MKREELESHLGCRVFIKLLDNTRVSGILEKSGEKTQDDNLRLKKNYYFVRDSYTNQVVKNLIFRCSHVKSLSLKFVKN